MEVNELYLSQDYSIDKKSHQQKKRKKIKSLRHTRQIQKQITKQVKAKRRAENKKLKKRASERLLKKLNSEHSFFKFIDDSEFYNKRKIKKLDNDALIRIPRVFSLIDNPDEAIGVYKSIYNVAYKKNLKGIFFDHSECKTLEIGASTVMDVFVMNIKEFRRMKGKKISFSGKLPPDRKNKIALHVSGILNRLDISKINELDNVKKLDLISGGKHSPTLKVSTSTASDDTQTKVSEYFNDCLATQEVTLTEEGFDYFCNLVGEAIDNCELHSGYFCQWFTLGFYFMEEGKSYGECNIVLFNFGQTIYEGLKNNTESSEMKRSLQALSDSHTKKGYFIPSQWDEESLWTLYALQDGVSRCRTEKEPDRGTGTVKLIEAFQAVGDTFDGEKKATMSIISGRSFIYYDGTYKLKEKIIGTETRQIIAFNRENDLELPPDKKYVRKLENYFPGTIISMQFFLEKRFIQNKIEGVSDDDND